MFSYYPNTMQNVLKIKYSIEARGMSNDCLFCSGNSGKY